MNDGVAMDVNELFGVEPTIAETLVKRQGFSDYGPRLNY